jgi:hypothetical protein
VVNGEVDNDATLPLSRSRRTTARQADIAPVRPVDGRVAAIRPDFFR